MRKNYTALYLPELHDYPTKMGFKTIKEAEAYIKELANLSLSSFKRSNWLVVETKVVDKHLNNLEVYEKEFAN